MKCEIRDPISLIDRDGESKYDIKIRERFFERGDSVYVSVYRDGVFIGRMTASYNNETDSTSLSTTTSPL